MKKLCLSMLMLMSLSGCTALAVGAGAAGGVVVGKELSED